MAERILVVEDEPDIQKLIRFHLDEEGYQVEVADSGQAGLEAIRRRRPSLVVLDLMLPDRSGTEVCRDIRGDPDLADLPVIMVTARTEEVDRLAGFELGADDYVAKPFSPRELVARVKGILRRINAKPPSDDTPGETFERGLLHVDIDRHRCTWDGVEVTLTVTEFGLLHSLCGMRGKVYTRDELVDRAYGAGHHITDRTVDSHVRRIRKKFKDVGGDPVETVYGLGYRLRDENE